MPVVPIYDQPDPEKLAKYQKEKALLQRAGFWVQNAGRTPVNDVRLVVTVERRDGLMLAQHLPERPRGGLGAEIESVRLRDPSLDVKQLTGGWELTFSLGKLQSSQEIWSEPFWIGSTEQCDVKLGGELFADDLSKPMTLDFAIKVSTKTAWLDDEGDP